MMMYRQMKQILASLLGQVATVDVNDSADIVFLTALRNELWLSDVPNHKNIVDEVVSHVRLEITVDPSQYDELRDLAKDYAKIVVAMLHNESFKALPECLKMAALRGLTFQYKG